MSYLQQTEVSCLTSRVPAKERTLGRMSVPVAYSRLDLSAPSHTPHFSGCHISGSSHTCNFGPIMNVRERLSPLWDDILSPKHLVPPNDPAVHPCQFYPPKIDGKQTSLSLYLHTIFVPRLVCGARAPDAGDSSWLVALGGVGWMMPGQICRGSVL